MNVEGTIALLHGDRESDVAMERFVLGSSGSVYGVPAALPIDEDRRRRRPTSTP